MKAEYEKKEAISGVTEDTDTSSGEDVAGELIASDGVLLHQQKQEREQDQKRQRQPSSAAEVASEQETRFSTARRMLLVSSLFLTLFLPALDQTIVSTALPHILSRLDPGSTQSDTGYTWIGSAYTLSQAVVMPLFGQASEVGGRKHTFLAAIALFTLGSALCGASQSVAMLIGARTVQGIGAGGITSLVYILVGDLVGTRKRGKYQGFIGATWAVASALGPVLGGVFVQSATWRWCFFVNLPICAICMVITFIFLQTFRPATTMRAAVAAFDVFGISSAAIATVLLLLAFEWASQGISWASARVLSCLILAGVFLGGLVVAEMRSARPVIPLRFFTHRTRIGAYCATFLHSMAYAGMNYYTPVYFQAVKGQSPSQSGVSLLPLVLAFAVVSTGSGYLITATRRYQEMIWAGFIVATLGCGLMVMLDQNTSTAVTATILVIAGIGVGPNFNSLLIPIHASFDDKSKASDTAMSSSAYAFIRAIGSSIGISIGGLICFEGLRSLNTETGNHSSVSQTIEALPSMTGAIREDTVAVFSGAMKHVFIQVAATMGGGMVASLLIQRHALGDKVRSNQKINIPGRRREEGETAA